MIPTLSLLLIAEKASTAQISVIRSFLRACTVPKRELALTSTSSITVNSRSSSNSLLKGWLNRAETFQSMNRISSPAAYSRTSRKLMPRPLKALWYSPVKRWRVSLLLFISSSRTFFNISVVVSMGLLWYGNNFQHFVNDVLDVYAFGFGFVGEADTVAQHILRNRAYILGDDITAFVQEGIRLCGEGQVDAGAGAAAIGDERLQFLQFIFFGRTGGEDDVEDIVFDLFIHIDLAGQLFCLHDLLHRYHLFHLYGLEALDVLADDQLFFLFCRIVNDHFHDKTVLLRFGQRIRSLLFARVLGRQDKDG